MQAQENTVVPPASESQPQPTIPDQTDAEKVAVLLQQCQPDRDELNKEFDALIAELMFEAIRNVEAALPDFRESGSADARLHAALRNRLLNAFNARRREIPQVTQNYILQQVYKREVVVRVVAQGHGPHNLPVGVEIRPRKAG